MNVKVLGITGLLLVLCGFMAVMTAEPWYHVTGSTFLQPNNVENLLRRTAMYGILGIGVAFVIISSGIDLSIGSVVCLSGCLLALFLQVEYRPFDYQPILEVRGAAREIVVAGDARAFAAGDRIRYFGGRRARNALVRVEAVEQHGGQSVIRVDQPLSNNDTYGEIAKVYAIESFDRGPFGKPPVAGVSDPGRSLPPGVSDPGYSPPPGVSDAGRRSHAGVTDPGYSPTVVLSGNHEELAARDQVILVSPGSGLKQLPILASESDGTRTTLTLANDLGGDFTAEWVAIPLERRQKMSVPGALLSVLGIALGLGLVHGLLVTRMKLPPFVVTLCGLLIYRGVSRWLVSDQPVGFGKEFEGTLSRLGSGKLVIREWVTDGRTETFGIPFPFFIALAVAIVAAVFLNRTIWGRYLLALGRNEDAARYSGINTGRITLVAYVICTVLAATGGILFALDSNSISPSSFGNFYELYAIAAAVLGGCSLRGGEGSIIGVIIGTAVMQVLYNLVVLMKISDTLEFAIIGAVILVGVVADELVRRLSSRRRAVDTPT